MPYIGVAPSYGDFKKLDSITVVNGQAAYSLQYNSAAYYPSTANALLVSVNGVVQAAEDAYTISGSTITFTENLVTGDVIDFIIALGDTGSAVTPVDGSVTTAKLANDAVTSDKLAHDITIANNLTVTGTVNASKAAGSYVTLSGSSHTFTNIPSVYNTLTLFLNGVSVAADHEVKVQFGTSGGIVTTGYWQQDSFAGLSGSNVTGTTDTNNDCFTLANWTGAANSFTGYYTFKTAGNDLWVSTGVLTTGTNNYFINQTGYIDLSAALTQIKISCGSTTFDSGSVNLLYG